MIRVAALCVLVVLVAGCASSSASPTVRPTLHLASLPAPIAEDSGAPDGGSIPPDQGSGAPDASSPDGSDASIPPPPADTLPPSPAGKYPDPDELKLLGHLRAQVSATCKRAGPFYPGELASLLCGDGVKIPFVYYTLFGNRDDMVAGYQGDIAAAVQQPDAKEKCNSGKYEDQYSVRARVEGRIWCSVGNSGGSAYKIIEWTRDDLLIIGAINSFDLGWDVLEAFWRIDAGPFG